MDWMIKTNIFIRSISQFNYSFLLKVNRLVAGILGLILVAGFGTPVFAIPVEQIVNGGFETGNFNGWTIQATGAWTINDGVISIGPTGVIPPISGSFDAVSEQSGPSLNMLSEPFVVPFGVQSANVNWNDRIFNHAGVFSDPNQEVRVEIRDSTGTTVLATIFDTNPGDTAIQPGPNARSFDITTIMQSLEGQTVRLCFTEEDNLFFFNYFVDDVSLTIDIMVIGGELLPIETTSLIIAGAQSFSWMIPIVLSGIGIGLFVVSRKSE